MDEEVARRAEEDKVKNGKMDGRDSEEKPEGDVVYLQR